MSEENTQAPLYAQKTFIDGKGERVSPGDEIEAGRYDEPTLAHYDRLKMVGEANPLEPAETKPAAPKEKKVKKSQGDDS